MKSVTVGHLARSWRDYAVRAGEIRLPVGFDGRLDAGECILVLSRASGHGAKARELAARTAHSAIELLCHHSGLDFMPVVPSIDTIVGLLESASTEVTKRSDGQEMRHQFVLIDLTDVAPLKLLVSTGTGRFVDESLSQPFIVRAANEYLKQNACLVAVKNSTRSGRHAAGTAMLMSAISMNNGAVCDEDGLGVVDLGRNLTSYIRGLNAEEQAKGMPEAVRRAQLTRTGHEMIAGRVQCHTASACPPGFGYAWLKSAGGSPDVRVLFLDSDACRPSDDKVAYGLSEVRYPSGHARAGFRVDQVENVRFALTHFGKTGWSTQKIVDALIKRHYSTDQYRNCHGADAHITKGAAHSVLDSILANLELYETGILRRSVGGGVEPLLISGCVPPDGPWADPLDFARIRTVRRERKAIRDTYTTLTFSGLHATLDDAPVVMLTDNGRTRKSRTGQLPYYTFFRADGYPNVTRAAASNRSLPPMEFAESIVRGLMDAAELPLDAFDPDEAAPSSDPELSRLRTSQARLSMEIEALERQREGLVRRLAEFDADGEPVLRGALLVDAQAHYNRVVEEELPSLTRRHVTVSQELDDILARQPKAAPADLLLHLVESLRNPTDRRFRANWLTSLHDVAFISSLGMRDCWKIKVVEWSGRIALTNGEEEVSVPFSGRFEYAPKGPLQDPIEAQARMAAAAMTSGVVPSSLSRRSSRLRLQEVAKELGVAPGHMLLNGCDDPRILKTATALLRFRGSISDVVAETSEIDAFVRRVRDVHMKQDAERPWRKEPSTLRVAFYVVAARNEGLVTSADLVQMDVNTSLGQVYNVFSEFKQTSPRWSSARKQGYRLASCECGSVKALLLSIPEPVGTVCASCRLDEAGIEWPAEAYDRYLAHPELW